MRMIETLRAVGANLGVSSGRQAVEEAAEAARRPRHHRGGARPLPRARPHVLRYYARMIEHLLTLGIRPHALKCCPVLARVEGLLSGPLPQPNPEDSWRPDTG